MRIIPTPFISVYTKTTTAFFQRVRKSQLEKILFIYLFIYSSLYLTLLTLLHHKRFISTTQLEKILFIYLFLYVLNSIDSSPPQAIHFYYTTSKKSYLFIYSSMYLTLLTLLHHKRFISTAQLEQILFIYLFIPLCTCT